MSLVNSSVFVGALTSLVGVCIGAYLSYQVSRKSLVYGIKVTAGKELRERFFTDLIKIRDDKDSDPYSVLSGSHPEHLHNAMEFRLYLPKKQRDAFDEAWKTYTQYDRNTKGLYLLKYSTKGCSVEEQGRRRQLAIDNINSVLRFTQP